MMMWLTILAIPVVAFLVWNLYRRHGVSRIAAFNERRRAGSKIVSQGQFVDGNRHVDVALALTQSTFFYENADMQASIDLQWLNEIEYDTGLSTGVPIHNGRVLRLRSHSQTFEFVLPTELVPRWHMLLPPRRARISPVSPVAVPVTAGATTQ